MAKAEKATSAPVGNQGEGKMREKTEERMATLQKYVSDMMAVEEHIGSAVKRQVKDENLEKHTSQASKLINRIAEATESHEQALKQHLEIIGGDKAKGIKEVATAVLGTLAGLYDKVRTEAVSKMLRDDYVALNLAAAGYTMLHTTGLALNDQATAALALRHLQTYTKIIMEINELLPTVVVTDLRDEGAVFQDEILILAIANTQAAWQPPQTGHANGHGNGNGISMTPAVSKPRAKSSQPTSNATSDADASAKATTPRKPRATKSKAASAEKTEATAATSDTKPNPKKRAAPKKAETTAASS